MSEKTYAERPTSSAVLVVGVVENREPFDTPEGVAISATPVPRYPWA